MDDVVLRHGLPVESYVNQDNQWPADHLSSLFIIQELWSRQVDDSQLTVHHSGLPNQS